ncbi:MAG: hypothetical protein Q4C85_02735 [Actinomyces sp.]|uniref:AMIN-like domain-containing (lipo)protein n=1 Tax=Actinomyces sp. TaxID=29317 RepID=UPI0026DC1870|nr:hypothetical protein [Actinomyces sp.]MDO4242672.1 hypothetical protein [Actinomyces sp.]
MSPQPSALPAPRSRRSMLRAARAAGVLAAVALPVAACSAGSSTVSSSTSPSSSTHSGGTPTTSTPSADASPAHHPLTKDEATAQATEDGGSGWTSTASEQTSTGDCGIEVDVRTGVHEGYDRVVVEMSGQGTPGWWADWVTDAATQGRGEPITVSGEHMLRVLGQGTSYPSEESASAQYTGSGPIPVGGRGVTEVWFDGTFESQFQLVIGTHSQSYRVFTLSEPTRLVIDVAHP